MVQLHCKSHFSFLEGASPIDSLVESAVRRGIRHLALTDRWGVYAAVAFCQKAQDAGLHPIVGAELPLPAGRITVLCRSATGYSALCRVLTRAHLGADWETISAPEDVLRRMEPDELSSATRQGRERTPSLDLADLAPLFEGCWILSDSPALLGNLADRFGPASLAAELVDHGRVPDGPRNRALLELASRRGVRTVTSNDVHFAEREEHDVQRLLTAIRLRGAVGKLRPGDSASPEAWLKGPAEMARLFHWAPEALRRAEELAESCEFRLSPGGMLHPPFPLPPDETAYSLLWKKAFAGTSARYRPLTQPVLRRLEHELDVICQTGYAEYFLIVADIAEFARREGIPTVGRGSAAGSLVAYALGFTHVDPLAHGLLFERFLNPERSDPPDVDLDFCWRRRHEVIHYLYRTYGPRHTAMLSTVVTLAGRGAIRESARALGMPEEEIGRYTRHIPYHDAAHLDEVLRTVPECRNLPVGQEPFRSVLNFARRIAGFPRHLGLHPCGVVLSRVPLTDVVPLQQTATGFAVTQFEMEQAETVGLLKIDILGQRSLTVLDDAWRAISAHSGESPPEAGTTALPTPSFGRHLPPLDDEATWTLLRSGRTMGCFQIESPGMRSLLRKLAPADLETIIAASSVIRPGPSDAGMLREYVERYRGTRPVTWLHPSLETVLDTTLGIMIYQEDILRVAEAIAGMGHAEADRLRRAMSSKRSAESMRSLRETFLERAIARGVAPGTAAEIWRQMETFSGYAFCKAHSASYAALSWEAAYLKAHHPAVFFAAVLTNGGGFYDAAAYVLEARRWGVTVLLPHINRSDSACKAEGGSVRLGLGLVEGLARTTIDRILAVRQEGPYTSFSDLEDRTGLGREETERLIRCGALDCFEFTRPELLWRLALQGNRAHRRTPAGPFLPFGEPEVAPSLALPRVADLSREERIRQEASILGLYVGAHPLELHQGALEGLPRNQAADLPLLAGKRVRLAGWLITTRRVFAKNRRYMKFITLEDESDIFEVVLFPEAYERWGSATSNPGAYWVEGRAVEELGVVTVEADRVEPLDQAALRLRSRHEGNRSA